MFAAIFGWITKSAFGSLLAPLTHITDKLADTKVAIAKEQNDSKRIMLEEKQSVLEARKEVILQAQKDPLERLVRIGFAIPFVVYIWKLVIWDKVLGWGATDDLSPDLWYVAFIILGGYFIDKIGKRFGK